MIIEGIVTTLDEEGRAHIRPMGPMMDWERRQLELRPFQGSQTLANLLVRPEGVFHCTDDALLIAQAVINRWIEPPRLEAAREVRGWVIPDACVWHEFACGFIDQTANRAAIRANILNTGRGRDFAGFNRAKHALLEAAIAISRLQFLPQEEIRLSLDWAARMVEKTGGPRERLALELLQTEHAAGKTGDFSERTIQPQAEGQSP